MGYYESLYESSKEELKELADRWKLSEFKLISSGNSNYVLACHSEYYGDVILKKSKNPRSLIQEYNALTVYNGKSFCRAYDIDRTYGVILEEQIIPGITLRMVASKDTRIEIFNQLYQGLHLIPRYPERFTSYGDWVKNITVYMKKNHSDHPLCTQMIQAHIMCEELMTRYPGNWLLHGDLHHDNILLNSSGRYTIIDPKGVTGHPFFDLSRFLLNELDYYPEEAWSKELDLLIQEFSLRFAIPITDLTQLFYIEMLMAQCWNMEDGILPDMDRVACANILLNRYDKFSL